MTAAPFPDAQSVADRLGAFTEQDQAFLKLLMENPVQDDNLLEGILRWLDQSTSARFLNTLKLTNIGLWLGNNAPGRLQIRLNETARSSQHAVYLAFKDGLEKSGGLARAFPKA